MSQFPYAVTALGAVDDGQGRSHDPGQTAGRAVDEPRPGNRPVGRPIFDRLRLHCSLLLPLQPGGHFLAFGVFLLPGLFVALLEGGELPSLGLPFEPCS